MKSVRYEWDERKRIANLEKHGIDFLAAQGFEWATAVVFEDDRRDYRETRLYAYGLVDRRLHVLVYTRRGDVRRIVSFRKANRREQAAYTAGYPGRGR